MPHDATTAIETLTSNTVYRNRWMTVREDTIRRMDGSDGLYGVVEKPDFAVILPIEDDGAVHLVEQYRYPVQGRYWELPQGSWEDAPDIDPLELARAELLEETGLEAAHISHAGHLFQAYGYATQGYHIFVARGLNKGFKASSHEEQDLVSRLFSADAVIGAIGEGRIKDATTVATLGFLRLQSLW